MEEKRTERTFWFTVARGFAWLVFHTVCPIRYVNWDKLANQKPPYLLLSNHYSWLDPLAVSCPIGRVEPRILGKKELVQNPIANYILRKLHMIPIDRHHTDMAGMRQCMKALKDGYPLLIFPEGTRHHAGVMENVESGFALIGIHAHVPMLPVLINGKIKPFRRTTVIFGDPIPADDLFAEGVSGDTTGILIERMRAAFRDMQKQQKI